MTSNSRERPPHFDAAFQDKLKALIAWRRDVRRFSSRPVPPALIEDLLDVAQLSASVGNSQPWRWLQIDSAAKRAQIRTNFDQVNNAASRLQPDARKQDYQALKLEGIDKAPYQFAVFCDGATPQGFGLGQITMPATLEYSTVAMITTFWLAARAKGLGVGWVSILEPDAIGRLLNVPTTWKLIAYLCVGWPEEEHTDPELERFGWQSRSTISREVIIV